MEINIRQETEVCEHLGREPYKVLGKVRVNRTRAEDQQYFHRTCEEDEDQDYSAVFHLEYRLEKIF
jgi:hypothetical protein